MHKSIIALVLLSASAHAATIAGITTNRTGTITNTVTTTTNTIRGKLELSATSSGYRYAYRLIPARKDRYDDVGVCVWTVSTFVDTRERWVRCVGVVKDGKGSGEYKELRKTVRILAVHAEMVRDGITLDTRDTLTTNQLKRLDIPDKWWLPGAKVK